MRLFSDEFPPTFGAEKMDLKIRSIYEQAKTRQTYCHAERFYWLFASLEGWNEEKLARVITIEKSSNLRV